MRIVLQLQQKKQQQQQQQQSISSSGSPSPTPAGTAAAQLAQGGEGNCSLVSAAAVGAFPGSRLHSKPASSADANKETTEDSSQAGKSERRGPSSSGACSETGKAKKRKAPSPAPASTSASAAFSLVDENAAELSSIAAVAEKSPPAKKSCFASVRKEAILPSVKEKAKKRKQTQKAGKLPSEIRDSDQISSSSGKASSAKKVKHQHNRPCTRSDRSSSFATASGQHGYARAAGDQKVRPVGEFCSSSLSRKVSAPPAAKRKESKMGRGPHHSNRSYSRSTYEWDRENDGENEAGPECDPADPIGVDSEAVGVIRYNCDGPEEEENNPAAMNSRRRHGAMTSSCSSSSSSLRRRRSSSFCAEELVALSDFEAVLKKRGLELVEQEGDGNCLFRAVSLQVYGDPNNHGEVRRRCLDFMAKDEPHFSQFITDEPFGDYIDRKRIDGVHGNNPEIQAISELFNRPVEVFVPENGAKPINIFHAEYKTADAPIRLSYHDGNHYNAVVDPLIPTAGLGLGLPGLEPGLADRLQLEKAKEESEVEKAAEESHKEEMDRVMKESKTSIDHMYKQKALALSDLEATDYELEQAVLESSLESYRNTEMGRKQPWSNRERRRQGNTSPVGSDENFGISRPSTAFRTHEEPMSSAASATVASPAPALAAAASAEGERDEYPETVQELVMNGFELSKVLRAYDLIGDNFDALLAFLMSNAN